MLKRCLTCQRVYSDESLKFCRGDGGTLVNVSAADAEAEAIPTLPLSARAGSATHGLDDGAAHETVSPASVETGKLKGPDGVRTRRRRLIALLIVLLAVLVAAAALVFYLRTPDAKVPIESIAVLPFISENKVVELKDLSEASEARQRTKRQLERDKETEELSSHLTRNIINDLAPLPNLRVMPPSATSHYKQKVADPVAAGRALGVHAVFWGEVSQLGDLLTIHVNLDDARHTEHVWGKSYQCRVENLDAERRAIARDLAECLRQNRLGKRCGS